MSPFIDDEDDEYYLENETREKTNEKESKISFNFLKDERRFFGLGIVVALVVFFIAIFVIYSSSTPINIDDLPVIYADSEPMKVKPVDNEQVEHQDKIIYDNISGDERKISEKFAQAPEKILSIPQMEVEETLSDEEKHNIIQSFEELAPEKEYKIDYITKVKKQKKADLIIVEEEPPLKKIKEVAVKKNKKNRMKDLFLNEEMPRVKSNNKIMLQIASLDSKKSAETEYKRILYHNKFLKNFEKRILKIDLGGRKGIKYRIHVGPFKSKNKAQEIIKLMQKNGFSAYVSG